MEAFFLIILISFGIGILLILLIATQAARKKKTDPQGRVIHPTWTQHQFEKLCLQLVEAIKLEPGEIIRPSDQAIDIYATNKTPLTGGLFIIHCLFREPEQKIQMSEILEFSNLVSQERASKGILITTGKIDLEATLPVDLAPLEFLPGEPFRRLVEEYRLRA
ncbi:MAG: restriction endonuclease [Deltaproteobacteria bacterium]|nr:restriction endonuclease [Deltaproteobacteria bacterium]